MITSGSPFADSSILGFLTTPPTLHVLLFPPSLQNAALVDVRKLPLWYLPAAVMDYFRVEILVAVAWPKHTWPLREVWSDDCWLPLWY